MTALMTTDERGERYRASISRLCHRPTVLMRRVLNKLKTQGMRSLSVAKQVQLPMLSYLVFHRKYCCGGTGRWFSRTYHLEISQSLDLLSGKQNKEKPLPQPWVARTGTKSGHYRKPKLQNLTWWNRGQITRQWSNFWGVAMAIVFLQATRHRCFF